MSDEPPDEHRQEGLEHFAPTGGRIMGILGLLMAAGVVVLWVLDRDAVPGEVAAGALVAGVVVWASLLHPRVSVTHETLLLRNMLETVHIPLAAIDELVVRQVMAVRVGDKRFVSPAVGRRLRKVLRAPRPAPLLGPTMPESMDDSFGPASEAGRQQTSVDYVDHVEGRLRELVAAARARHGVRAYSDEAAALAGGVRRQPSWPTILGLAGATLVFVLTLLL